MDENAIKAIYKYATQKGQLNPPGFAFSRSFIIAFILLGVILPIRPMLSH